MREVNTQCCSTERILKGTKGKVMSNNSKNFNKAQQERLEHVISHSLDDFKDTLALLHENKGSRTGCLMTMGSSMEAKSIVSYFRDDDLEKFKYENFLGAYLFRMSVNPEIEDECDELFPDRQILFLALMSDHEALIDWIGQFAGVLNTHFKKSRNLPKNFYCHPFHLILAMNGHWDELIPRCEAVLAANPAGERKYMVDHRFMLALAKGDEAGMLDALTELTSSKRAKRRNREFGLAYYEEFISLYACIFMKLAYRNGYELDFESQWIPKDWIPIKPLDSYPIPEDWHFMKGFDIWSPLINEYEKWTPKPNARIIIA